jgi:NAD(P)-dependent dehydrogenase (short-subunit alcohol dehydrogenase family)
MNSFSLLNKTVLVTGAAGLLAEQYIDVVLQNQGSLVLVDINLNKLKKIKNLICKDNSNKIYIYKGDVTKVNQMIKICKSLKKLKIKIDVLINNAAINYKMDNGYKNFSSKTKLENFSTKIWKKDLDVALLGSLNCIKIFGNEMVKNKYGIILNVASDLSIIAPDNRIYNNGKKINIVKPISYSVAKHGVIGLTKYVAAYWGGKNVRCNAIAPGGVYDGQPKKFLNKISKLIPMGRLAKKNEYKSTILYLISDASSYMNGSVLIIDGGRTIL